MPLRAMTNQMMIHRLYADPSLTSHLDSRQAEYLLSWAEGEIEEYSSETEFEKFCDELRLLNHYISQGGGFNQLFARLRNGTLNERSFYPIQGEQHRYQSSFGLIY
ncbi:MAG: hypothetical protein AB7H80_10400 [Candidatus Kapaibacterium sp.]